MRAIRDCRKTRVRRTIRGNQGSKCGHVVPGQSGRRRCAATPAHVFKVRTTSSTPMSTLTQSSTSAASSRVKSIASRFRWSAYWSAGPPHACKSLPIRTKAQDDPASAPSSADPSVGSTSSGAAPLVVRGVDGADAEVCPVTTMAEDAPAVFSVCPTAGAAACADDDPGCNGAVISGCTAFIMGTAVSVCTGDGPIYAAFACGITVALGHDLSAPSAVVSTCGITSMPDSATSLVGAPCAPSFIYPSADAAIATGGTPQWAPWASQRHSRLAWRRSTPGVSARGRGSSLVQSAVEHHVRWHCKGKQWSA